MSDDGWYSYAINNLGKLASSTRDEGGKLCALIHDEGPKLFSSLEEQGGKVLSSMQHEGGKWLSPAQSNGVSADVNGNRVGDDVENDGWKKTVLYGSAGAVAAVGGATVLLPLLGFGTAGITAGSAVATLQSAGAAGMATSTKIALGAAGAYSAQSGGASADGNGNGVGDNEANSDEWKKTVLYGSAGAAAAVAGATVLLPLLGFGTAGIAAGSAAATLQSAGAAGMAVSTKIGLGVAGAYSGNKIADLYGPQNKKDEPSS